MGSFLYPLSTPLFPLSSHVLFKFLVYFKEHFFKYKIYIFFEGTKSITKKQNTKIKQQGIQVDQLYIHNEVNLSTLKHLY